MIKKENVEVAAESLEIINFDKTRRLYGLKIGSYVHLATLTNLPCIIETMKTLDNFNFYKS